METDDNDIIFVNMDWNPQQNSNLQNEMTIPSPIKGNYLSLREEMKDKCNPKLFLEPFDEQKILRANNIYKELDSANDSRLEELRHEALLMGILFTTEKIYNQLIEQWNPQNYMEPYDATLVDYSTKVYQRIRESADNIETLETIKAETETIKIQTLIQEFELKKKLIVSSQTIQNKNIEDEKNARVMTDNEITEILNVRPTQTSINYNNKPAITQNNDTDELRLLLLLCVLLLVIGAICFLLKLN